MPANKSKLFFLRIRLCLQDKIAQLHILPALLSGAVPRLLFGATRVVLFEATFFGNGQARCVPQNAALLKQGLRVGHRKTLDMFVVQVEACNGHV